MSERPSLTYRSDIDGLRAVAVLLVILFHFNVPRISGGYVGVDVFFVISGFLITSIIAGEMEAGTYSLARFYERRVRRIFPALFLMLVVCCVGAWLWLLPKYMRSFGDSLHATTLFMANLYFHDDAGYFSDAAELKPLLHTWSLAVEEQFYLFFPPLLALALRLRRGLAVAGMALLFAASLSYAWWLVESDQNSAFFLLPSRSWELMAGALLALGAVPKLSREWQRNLLGMLGLASILVAAFAYDEHTTFPGAAALLPCLGAAAIVHAGSSGSHWVGRVLGMRGPVFIGLMSYSLYLWHWPLMVLARHRLVRLPGPTATLVVALLTFVFSLVSLYWVERPARHARAGGSRAWVLVPAVLVSALFAWTGSEVGAGDGLAFRVPSEVVKLASVSRVPTDSMMRRLCSDDARARGGKLKSACRVGEPRERESFLFWGDSHASALAPQIADIALKHGISGLVRVHASCPPLLGVAAPHCPNAAPIDSLLGDMKDGHLILHARWAISAGGLPGPGQLRKHLLQERVADSTEDPERLRAGLRVTLETAAKHDVHVTVIASVPEVAYDVPSSLAKELWFGSQVELRPSLAAFHARQRIAFDILRDLQRDYGFSLVYPHQALCRRDYCEVERGGRPLYSDDDHLSAAGASRLRGLLTQVLLGQKAQKSSAIPTVSSSAPI